MAVRSTDRPVDRARRHRHRHRAQPEHALRPRPVSRRRLWAISVGGVTIGMLMCTLPFLWGSGRPPQSAPVLPAPVPAPTTPEMIGEPTTMPELESPSASPSTPEPRTSSPSPKPSASATATPGPVPSPTPALLGPASNGGLADMVQRYCDRHSGGSADARGDGRWECQRLLSSSIVDMNVACRDAYGSGAFARTSRAGDPYAWRCYR